MELEAARAHGFTQMKRFRFIILPQTLRLSLPSLTNQVIQNLKGYLRRLPDPVQRFFGPDSGTGCDELPFLKAYLLAGLIYLILVSVVVLVARRLETRFILPEFSDLDSWASPSLVR